MGEKVDDDDEILKQVFGDSSDDEYFEEQPAMEDSAYEVGRIHGWEWEQVREIKGLWLCRSFLSPEQQTSLLSEIRNGFLSYFSCNFQSRVVRKEEIEGKIKFLFLRIPFLFRVCSYWMQLIFSQ